MISLAYIGEEFFHIYHTGGRVIELKKDGFILPSHIDREMRRSSNLVSSFLSKENTLILIFETRMQNDFRRVWSKYFSSSTSGLRIKEIHVADVIMAGKHSITDKPQTMLLQAGLEMYILQKSTGYFTDYKKRKIRFCGVGKDSGFIISNSIINAICSHFSIYPLSFYKDQGIIVFCENESENETFEKLQNALEIPVVSMLADNKTILDSVRNIIADKAILELISHF